MSEINSPPPYTHFDMVGSELPPEFYLAMGRALYRWSQLEATVCTLATSSHSAPWLEAMQRLRGGTGFKVKNIFEMLNSKLSERANNGPALEAVRRAQQLYEARKVLFHSVWGAVRGPAGIAPGILEWSNTSFGDFRDVTLKELDDFARDCHQTWIGIMKEAIPLFHEASSIVVDDDGVVTGHDWPESAKPPPPPQEK